MHVRNAARRQRKMSSNSVHLWALPISNPLRKQWIIARAWQIGIILCKSYARILHACIVVAQRSFDSCEQCLKVATVKRVIILRICGRCPLLIYSNAESWEEAMETQRLQSCAIVALKHREFIKTSTPRKRQPKTTDTNSAHLYRRRPIKP